MGSIKRFDKVQGFAAEAGRVLDITDDRWGHPEVISPWALPVNEDTYCTYDPDVPLEKRREQGSMFQKMLDDMWMAQEHTCKIEKLVIPGCVEDPDTDVEIYIFTPNNLKREKGNPVLFEVPGGGLGTWCAYAFPMDKVCEELQCVGVVTRYRVNWEAPYPGAVNDLHASYQWALDHIEEYAGNPKNITVTGQSSGAQLALCLGFRLKRYGITPKGIVAMGPQTDDRIGEDEAVYAGMWDTFAQRGALACWLGDRHNVSIGAGPEALPNRASVEDCKGYPPTFIHTGELDPDRDANAELCSKLNRAHAYCEHHCWGGTSHNNSSWYYFSGVGEASEFGDILASVIYKNLRDCMRYDLRRSWLEEE